MSMLDSVRRKYDIYPVSKPQLSANFPFVTRPPYPDRGILRQGKAAPRTRRRRDSEYGTLASALKRAGYIVGPNGGSVRVRITRVHDETILEYFN